MSALLEPEAEAEKGVTPVEALSPVGQVGMVGASGAKGDWLTSLVPFCSPPPLPFLFFTFPFPAPLPLRPRGLWESLVVRGLCDLLCDLSCGTARSDLLLPIPPIVPSRISAVRAMHPDMQWPCRSAALALCCGGCLMSNVRDKPRTVSQPSLLILWQ